jgi:hypothetical protein
MNPQLGLFPRSPSACAGTTPAQIAARMPHRRASEEKAVDQLAESELGRLALRGELEPVLATAGADYAQHWRGYIASLCAPRAFVACRR